MVGFVLLAASGRAATVIYIQTSVNDVDGSPIGAVSSNQYLESGISYSTVTAPSAFSSYRFTHWTNSSYPATIYRDAWGRSLNPISLVLLEDTTAAAHYLPASRDTDGDGVPDWYELEYFAGLSRDISYDGDVDGITLLAEYTGGTHPLYANTSHEGGVAWADSALVTANLTGNPSYTLASVPAGTVNQTAIVPPGTVVTTPNLSTNTSFGYWALDGVRQQDAWGVGVPQVSFPMASVNREAVAYLFIGDADGDNVPDAYEQYYYGTLTNGATSDTDGDGIALLAERSGGTNPLYGNSRQEGGVAWVDSALVTVNLAGFHRYTLSSVPAGTINQSAIVPNGTVITTADMTQSTFGYWELDGVRQQDAWGVARRQLTFTVNDTDRVGVAHLFTGDGDGDGVNDGFEQYYYGTVANGAASDSDGDGIPLLLEFTGGTHPLYANSPQEGGVAWADSALALVDTRQFLDTPHNGLPDWWEQQYGLNLLDPNATLDLDGDGLPGRLEYAFGGNPSLADLHQRGIQAGSITVGGQTFVRLGFYRRFGDGSLVFRLQEATTLGAWNDLDLAQQTIATPQNMGDGTEFVTVRGTISVTGDNAKLRGFLRLLVERP